MAIHISKETFEKGEVMRPQWPHEKPREHMPHPVRSTFISIFRFKVIFQETLVIQG